MQFVENDALQRAEQEHSAGMVVDQVVGEIPDQLGRLGDQLAVGDLDVCDTGSHFVLL